MTREHTAPLVGWYRIRSEKIHTQRHEEQMSIRKIAEYWQL